MVDKIGAPTDGGWGWFVVAASFFMRIIMDGICYSFGIIVVPLINYFNASRQEIGWIGSLLAGTSLCIGPIASLACNYFGCRKVAIMGTITAALGMLASSLATNPWILTVTYGFIVGLGSCFVLLPTIVCVAYYFENKRSLALGLSCCGSGVGTFLIGYLTEYLVNSYGWNGTMIIESGLLLNCCAFSLVLVEPPVRISRHKCKDNQHIQIKIANENIKNRDNNTLDCSSDAVEVDENNKMMSLKNTTVINGNASDFQSQNGSTDSSNQNTSSKNNINNKTTGMVVRKNSLSSKTQQTCGGLSLMCYAPFAMFMITSFVTCLGPLVPYLFLADKAFNLGYSQEESANLIPAIGISNIFGRIAGGIIGDRKFVNKLALFSSCLIICGLVVCFIALWSTYWYMICCAVMFGFFYGGVVTLLPVVLVDLVSLDQLNFAYGFGGLFGGLGLICGPPLAGAIFDKTKSYDITFFVMGISTIIGSLCNGFICLMPSYKKRHLLEK